MKCRVCNFKTKKIYTTPDIPEYVWPSLNKNKFSKCEVFVCKKYFSLQLQNFSKKKIKSFYGKESFNIITKEAHLKRISKIKKFYGVNFFKNKKIIDVGGGVNPILNDKNCDVFDFKISKNDRKKLKGKIYLGDIEKIYLKKKYDIVFLLHTLEHLPNPLKVINKIEKILKKEGVLFLEVPSFDNYIKKTPYYAVFHQHLNMYVLENLKNLISFTNLQIKNFFSKNDVIFCSIIKKKKLTKINKISYAKKIVNLKKNLTKQKVLLNKFVKNEKINIFGAGGSAALFIANNPFIKKRINYIYDNDPKKIGKIFPGTKIKIKKTNNIQQRNKSISFYKKKNKKNYYINPS